MQALWTIDDVIIYFIAYTFYYLCFSCIAEKRFDYLHIFVLHLVCDADQSIAEFI